MTNTAETWGFSTLAVAILSIVSLLGIVFIKSTKSRSWILVSDFLMSLGASTIFCDAMLHLIAHALDLHGHEHGEEEVEHSHVSFSLTDRAVE